MPAPVRAAIYARISLDAEGEGKGVNRQTEDCQKLAAALGWSVAGEYIDNDISAYSGKHRPEYTRMLEDMRSCAIDGVLIYHLDRLTRRPVEFEQFHALAEASRIPLRCVTGDLDLGTDDGLFLGRIQAAIAAQASSATGRRQRRKNDERAAAGLPHGGSVRPFGFDDDKITHRPDEVALIRLFLARFLAGESPRSLATWANEQPIRPSGGDLWRSHVVRNLLTSPRSAGLREHRDGRIVGKAAWDPVISEEERDRVLAMLESKRTTGRRTPRRYLLSGVLRCGHCGNRLYSAARKTTRRYVCMSGPDHEGCGGITVVARPVERLISDTILLRLDTTEMAAALAGSSRNVADTAPIIESISADREQLDQLAASYARNKISHAEWMTARTIIENRMEASKRKLHRATKTTQLAPLIGHGSALRGQWETLNLDRQQAIVTAVMLHAVIKPGIKGFSGFDPNRVEPVWRL
jgi:DNA invertase Pin-like site-specific DNA recombinase